MARRLGVNECFITGMFMELEVLGMKFEGLIVDLISEVEVWCAEPE